MRRINDAESRVRPRRKRLVRSNRVPKVYRDPMTRLERHPAHERRVLSLKQMARRIMAKRRAELRAKHVHGGKVLVGPRRHGGGGGWKGHHRHGKMSPKMRRFLLWKYHH